MKRFKKIIIMVICFTMLINGSSPSIVFSAVMTDIRIGLTSSYDKKLGITISTEKIAMGYCIKDSYTSEISFTSKSGFMFTAAKGYYYIVNKTYSSFYLANEVASQIKSLGVDAYPTSIYRNVWKVYVGGSTKKEEMQAIYERIYQRFGLTYEELSGDNKYRVLVTGNQLSFLMDGGVRGAFPQFKSLLSNKNKVTLLDLGARQYRGRIEVGRYHKETLTAVNVINVESYLFGVVASEMPRTYPLEALKAQAVSARSYALMKTNYRADSDIKNPYYLNDTTSHQAYKGYGIEYARASNAVMATKGMVISYKGKIITAYYSSTSGGKTENVNDVWGSNIPYLKSVVDVYETEPEKKPWVVTLTKSQIASKLNRAGFSIGSVKGLLPEITTSSGRVYSLKIRGTKSNAVLQVGTIREVLDLSSTKFKIVEYGDKPDTVAMRGSISTATKKISDSYVLSASGKVEKVSETQEQYIVRSEDNLTNFLKTPPKDKDTFFIAGMGFGHGVGMSQSGAKGMANAGFTYPEIIEHYYIGCKVIPYK